MGCSNRNQRIKIFKPENKADGMGGYNTSYVLYQERWAQVLPPAFREQQAQGAPMSREQLQIKLGPADRQVRRGWRIEWQGETYTVDTADNTYRERTLLVVHTLNPGD